MYVAGDFYLCIRTGELLGILIVMSLTWAQKRQMMYITGIVAFFLVVLFIIYFAYFYKQPTCFDGQQNGDEYGVDCGGGCERVCDSQVRDLTVVWAEALPVTQTTYNAVAYIENANTDFEARNLEYEFIFYGSGGVELDRRTGETFVPRNMRIAIFEEQVSGGSQSIVRTEFRFTHGPEWYVDSTPEPTFQIEEDDLEREETAPRVEALLTNTSVKTLYDIDAVSIVYDDFGTPIAASRSIIPRLGAGESQNVVYTWPRPFVVGERTCQVPVDVVLAVDRSGSMDDDGLEPPQPLTDVKNAARSFVEQLSNNDRVSVVSFANTATQDQSLTFDHGDVRQELSSVKIFTDGIQHTNVADGVQKGFDELRGGRATSTARHALVLLTDGVATRPVSPSGGDNTVYAEAQAMTISEKVRAGGYQLYTIGLGQNVNPDFLRNMATTPDHYFQAPSSDKLDEVYTKIASSICKLGPKVVEIIPRLPVDQY